MSEPTSFSEQVYYIQYIKELPLKEARAAEMAVMTGHYQDAENLLLQSGLIFRAVLLNIYLHQWERALDLAVKVLMSSSLENSTVTSASLMLCVSAQNPCGHSAGLQAEVSRKVNKWIQICLWPTMLIKSKWTFMCITLNGDLEGATRRRRRKNISST